MLIISSMMFGCATQSDRTIPVYNPPEKKLEDYRTPSTDDEHRAIKTRDKFINFYNNNQFEAAYSQLKPVDTVDYPIKKSDFLCWKRVFTESDILLIQVVAAFKDDRELFNLFSEGTGYESDKCVALLREAAKYDWIELGKWARCYNRFGKDPRYCSSHVFRLAEGVTNIHLVLGKASGFCRSR